jgi:hypothetical protein
MCCGQNPAIKKDLVTKDINKFLHDTSKSKEYDDFS